MKKPRTLAALRDTLLPKLISGEIRVKAITLSEQVFHNPNWTVDPLVPLEEWKREVEKWLQYVYRKGQLGRYKLKLGTSRARQRDAALAEIFSAYFMEEMLGHEVLRWEEKTTGDRDVDFIARLNSEEVFCEVKSPGWEGELEQQERLGERKDLPKVINREAHDIAPWQSIRHVIAKVDSKFLSDRKNLVIMCDDLFVSPLDLPDDLNFEIALHAKEEFYGGEKGYFADGRFKNVGALLALTLRWHAVKGAFKYQHRFVPNPHATLPFSLA